MAKLYFISYGRGKYGIAATRSSKACFFSDYYEHESVYTYDDSAQDASVEIPYPSDNELWTVEMHTAAGTCALRRIIAEEYLTAYAKGATFEEMYATAEDQGNAYTSKKLWSEVISRDDVVAQVPLAD